MVKLESVLAVAVIIIVTQQHANSQINLFPSLRADFTKPGYNVPYHLSLQFQGFKHFCSAVLSIYPNRYLWPLDSTTGMPTMPATVTQRQFGLSSAACVNHSIWPIFAVAGQTDNKDRKGAQIRVVNAIHRHPNFSRQTMENNITILFFEWEFKPVFTATAGKNKVWPINYDIPWHISNHDHLNISNHDPPHATGTDVYLTGYGFMFPGVTEATKHMLQVVKSKVIDPATCENDKYTVGQKKYYDFRFSRCYENTKRMDRSQPCYGDDGAVVVTCNIYDDTCQPEGPTVVTDHAVIGILNNGHDCFHKIEAAFFTVVSCYSMSYMLTTGTFIAGWFETVLNAGNPLPAGAGQLTNNTDITQFCTTFIPTG